MLLRKSGKKCLHTEVKRRYVGGYSEGDHLLPFRTEKLSPSALMVLPLGGRVGRRQPKIKLMSYTRHGLFLFAFTTPFI